MKLKSNTIIISLLFLIMGIMLCYRLCNNSKINKHKVYTLGKVYNISKGAAHGGSVYYYYYIYKNTRYNIKFGGSKILGVPNKDSLVFIELDSLEPNVYSVLEFTPVPDCLKFEDVPFNGWEELPKCK